MSDGVAALAAAAPPPQAPAGAHVVVVTSGKGGVGKTTSSAALAASLACAGHRVVLIDFDVGLRNLDLAMGMERRVVFDLIDVIRGQATVGQALIPDGRCGGMLSLLPASQTTSKDALTEDGVASVIAALRPAHDWIVCDSPAGIEAGAALAMAHAQTAVIVCNPEISSIRDSDRIVGMLDTATEMAKAGSRPEKHVLLTRYDPRRVARRQMMSAEDVREFLGLPFLGIVPESHEILTASNNGTPVTLAPAPGRAARAYREAARRLAGERLPPPRVPRARFLGILG